MLTEFSRKRSRKLKSILIIAMALFTIGICVLSQRNTVHAQEINNDEQTTQHAAAMSMENKSEGSNISYCTYSCIWFGNCD